MGIENKTYRKNFQTFDDKSFILDDFDDELELYIDPTTKIAVHGSSIEVHSPNYSHDETFAL